MLLNNVDDNIKVLKPPSYRMKLPFFLISISLNFKTSLLNLYLYSEKIAVFLCLVSICMPSI